jgi:hypothetical protein
MPETEQTQKETKKNPARVLSGLKGMCTRKGQKVKAELDGLEHNESISQEEATELKTLLSELNEQYNRLEKEWEVYVENDLFTDDAEHTKLQKIVSEAYDFVADLEKNVKHLIRTKAEKVVAPPPVKEQTTTTSDKRWKPRDEYKPDRLHLSDRPTVLDTWVSKLKSYLSGHENQPHNDLFNLLDGLIDDEIKTAINFNRREETPIFGENGLVEQIFEIWKKEYPINKLRMALFDMKCGPSEDWNSWEAKMKEEASKADLNALKGEDILALLIIMKYEGPHAVKIKSELSKKANSSDKKEICLLQARQIYSDEKYSSKFVTTSTVKQINPQQGGKNPNRGQRQTNDKGSTRSGHAVYNQNQTRAGTNRTGTKFMDTEKAKEMVKEGRCTRCYKQNCPGKAKDKECPDIKTLSCTYCKKLNKPGTGHVEGACVTKWTRENAQQGATIRQMYTEVTEENDQ